MHTEHLQNVRASLIAAGWLIALAVTSLLFLALAGAGAVDPNDTESRSGALWALATVGAGFFVGGFVAGFRALHAPILHGLGIGIASLVAWFALNLLVLLLPGGATWEALPPLLSASLLLEQMILAIAGAWIGYRIALRDQPEPEE